MTAKQFYALFKKNGVASIANKSKADESVTDQFQRQLKDQIAIVKQAISDKAPPSVKNKKTGAITKGWGRGHWVKQLSSGEYAVQIGFPAINLGDDRNEIRYAKVKDLQEALTLLEAAEPLTEDRDFVEKLEDSRAKRKRK